MKLKELKNIIVLDIETISAVEKFELLPDRLQAQWIKKARYLRNEEEISAEELFFEKGGIYAEFGKIISIAVGVFHENEEGETAFRVKAFSNDDEEKLLTEFKGLIEERFNSDRLKFCSHNGKEFDYPYLCRRMLINRIDIPNALNLRDRKPWEVQHLDTLDMWKFGDRKNYTSLELLTALFNIDSSKETEGDYIDGSQVNEVYYRENDLERISKYCKNDVVATAQLFLCLNNLDQIKKKNITILD